MSDYHDPYNDGYPEDEDPQYIGDEWKRGGGQSDPELASRPVPTPSVLRWYSEAARLWVATELFTHDGGLGWIPMYQKWYTDRPTEFLIWEPPVKRFSMLGGWRLGLSEMSEAVDRAD